MRPGRRCPSRAVTGRLRRSRLTTCVVVMQLPPGWTTVMGPWGIVLDEAGACSVSSVQEAAVSISAVLWRSGGFAQLKEVPLT